MAQSWGKWGVWFVVCLLIATAVLGVLLGRKASEYSALTAETRALEKTYDVLSEDYWLLEADWSDLEDEFEELSEEFEDLEAELVEGNEERDALQAELMEIQDKCPPRHFVSRADLQTWRNQTGVVEAGDLLLSCELLQDLALRDGYVLSVCLCWDDYSVYVGCLAKIGASYYGVSPDDLIVYEVY